MTTKETIIYESLKLFSVHGFDAVSTRMIARAVNASDAVIYKHFKSKKEILDCIMEQCMQKMKERNDSIQIESMCWKDVENICMGMFRFQTTDEWITKFRQLLIIEQYKNPEMKALYRNIFIDGPLQKMSEMFQALISLGYMKEGNPMVYAMDLYAPFFMFHTIGGESEELLKTLKEHVTVFRKNVVTDLCFLDDDSTGI